MMGETPQNRTGSLNGQTRRERMLSGNPIAARLTYENLADSQEVRDAAR